MYPSRAWSGVLALGWCLGAASAAPAPSAVRPVRVLLFASAPMRDYQFLRIFLVRQADKKRVALTIHLQPPPGRTERRTGVVQDVPPDNLLKTFPSRLGGKPGKASQDDLGSYDVIVAFDPDWDRLNKDQLGALRDWVKQGGGFILVAGPVNTTQLGRAIARKTKLRPVLDMLPVVPDDIRITERDRRADKPWRLHFPDARTAPAFLKLDPKGKGPLAGWEDFFGKKGAGEGFYGFYPVKKVKPAATVLATFADPKAKLPDGKEQPYLVTMPFGKGRVVYLGSGEVWRLRKYREAFHEHFWKELIAYAARRK